MIEGDLVRFAKPEEVDTLNSKSWPKTTKRHMGILVRYDKLMKTAYVLHEDEVIKLRAVFVEKTSTKDVKK